MRIMTVLGTRPEIIRLSALIPRLDAAVEHVLVHTGQNFDPRLSDIFFAEFGLRAPDHHLGINEASASAQLGAVIARCGALFDSVRPDRLLVLGDTNSALCAIIAKRMGIPVFHMEAGNRCFDDRVPEEVNRRIVDHCSDILLPYTERSRQNLLREGIPGRRIFVTGNPIAEVLENRRGLVEASEVLSALELAPQSYVLATLHRAENTDDPVRLAGLMQGLSAVAARHSVPVVLSTHPRLRSRLAESGMAASSAVRLLEPFGFSDFVALQRSALCVLSDSGTVQEECTILGVRAVTLRDVTERPETLEGGSNILSGGDPGSLLRAVDAVLSTGTNWRVPLEYMAQDVSGVVLRLLLGHLDPVLLGP
jgi:UDP-N-acetylglucosamine 2-epimerase (non-hydrolysing)